MAAIYCIIFQSPVWGQPLRFFEGMTSRDHCTDGKTSHNKENL